MTPEEKWRNRPPTTQELVEELQRLLAEADRVAHRLEAIYGEEKVEKMVAVNLRRRIPIMKAAMRNSRRAKVSMKCPSCGVRAWKSCVDSHGNPAEVCPERVEKIREKREVENTALKVRCPVCGAPKNKRCRRKLNGLSTSSAPHKTRINHGRQFEMFGKAPKV